MKRSQSHEEWGMVFQAEGTAGAEALRWRKDQLARV
jgi:hypothetical protein